MPAPNLDILSKYLAVNAICHATDGKESIQNTSERELNLLSTEYNDYKMSRNILIIGAGASSNANQHIPTAKRFAAHIKDQFIKQNTDRYTKLIQENKQVKRGQQKVHKDIQHLVEKNNSALTDLRTQNEEINRRSIERQIDYLARVNTLRRDEFETIMLACSRIDNEFVLDELKDNYDYKHVSNLFYEIVGHLFKHRFIDIIIDFNFDELMNNVIEEEMNGMPYNYVLFDGDMTDDWDDLMLEHRLKEPIYIKPHGTISHPSSLRFNKEQYYSLPSRIAGLLDKLFTAQYHMKKGKGTETECLQLNIITAGFGMQSMDFNYILEQALLKRESYTGSPSCKLFVFDRQEKKDYIENIPASLRKKDDEKINITYYQVAEHAGPLAISDQKDESLEGHFLALWHQIEGHFKTPGMLLRGISRHMIISLFFQNNKNPPLRIFQKKDVLAGGDNALKSQLYLLARILVEMAILLVNSDGMTNMTQIKESRINKYYLLLRKVLSILDPGKTERLFDEDQISLLTILGHFGFRKYKRFVNDTFVYDVKDQFEPDEFRKKIVSSLFEQLEGIDARFKEILNKKPKTGPTHTIKYINFWKGELRNAIEKNFEDLHRNPAWMVKPNFSEYQISKFRNVTDRNFLHTDLRFNLQRKIFFNDRSKDWNILLSSSKRASFLREASGFSKILEGKKHQVCIVLSRIEDNKAFDLALSSTIPQHINGIYDPKQKDFRRLPWWLHNQHTHIFLKFKLTAVDKAFSDYTITDTTPSDIFDADFIEAFTGGVYYQRRMLSRKINPIYFDHSNGTRKKEDINALRNIKELVDTFVNYWARAQFYEKEESSDSIMDNVEFLEHKFKLFQNINHHLRSRS